MGQMSVVAHRLLLNVCFSKQHVEMEHEREVVNSQLQKQSDDIVSTSDVLSDLSRQMKSLHQTLYEQSQLWLQVCFCHLCLRIQCKDKVACAICIWALGQRFTVL